jgi:hypothetical protein
VREAVATAIGLALLVVAFALAVEARAAEVPYQPVARFTWTPASGPVAGYVVCVFEGEAQVPNCGRTVTVPEVSIPVPESGALLGVVVTAYDAAGQPGPSSDPSEPLTVLALAPAPDPDPGPGEPDAPIVLAANGRLCLERSAGAAECYLVVTDATGRRSAHTLTAERGCWNHAKHWGDGEAVASCGGAPARVAVRFESPAWPGPPVVTAP